MRAMPSNAHPTRRRDSSGFTLIEMMIVVVVIGLLAAVAFPSFMDSIRKGRRSEAFSALSAVQQAQERWRGNNANYTTTLASLNVNTPTSSGYYDITVTAPSSGTLANGYIALAVGKAGTSQENDAQCRKVGVQVVGGTITYGGCGGCADLTFAATNPCWSR